MNNSEIRIGSLIRFLNSIGGGRVSRINGDTAWVEDEDGFEIPTLLSECVVVEEEDTFMPAYKPPVRFQSSRNKTSVETSSSSAKEKKTDFEELYQPEQNTVTTRPAHTYVPASGKINVALLYTPEDDLRLGTTNFITTLVNKSKYTLLFTYALEVEGTNQYLLQGYGTLLPEQKLELEPLTQEKLSQTSHINVQLLVFAENPGVFKGNYSFITKLDGKKFLKSTSYVANDYLPIPSLQFELIKDDQIVIPTLLEIDVKAIEHKLHSQIETKPFRHPQPNKPNINDPLVVDLHIDELLDNISGLDNRAILEYQTDKFHEVMKAHLPQRGKKIIFIHGKGEGVLRNRIERELKHKYKRCRYQDASFEQYSYGATQVTIG